LDQSVILAGVFPEALRPQRIAALHVFASHVCSGTIPVVGKIEIKDVVLYVHRILEKLPSSSTPSLVSEMKSHFSGLCMRLRPSRMTEFYHLRVPVGF
jgi:hypothetical protein